ncbi:DNA alkylation repair protein [Paenibacillus sp. SC116]|uniref:DNA alkylation repair protein n=1 Tax=Paenibacillus sp. SC116 TaxID=2968986 RepID=UPI00215B0C71|nr:DNA alkylation repair protein [Paenibacillus sp. SC116]MCR8845894.1 DNA alkylation repair protein [Paenibacillus sp. SC116]
MKSHGWTLFFPERVINRKGAVRAADIPDDIKQWLNEGVLESVNLMEWLAVDHVVLVQHVLPRLELGYLVEPVIQQIDQLKEKKVMKAMPLVGKLLYEALSAEEDVQQKAMRMESIWTHGSDSVRCWGCYMISANPDLSLQQKLEKMKRFAADKHFGVREIAWMAVRDHIARDLSSAIEILSVWTHDEDANIRRFAVEATRPCGVWTSHIQGFKLQPELALPLLEQVKSDPSKYVQDSVGNWLNDASKSKPEWVLQICGRWTQESDSKETSKIVKRATRTLKK